MLNPHVCLNTRPDGFGVLEVAGDQGFAPLTRTDLAGDITGPLAALRLTQTFVVSGPSESPPVEALYRFPLPGDAAVTGVRVTFGEVTIQTVLSERTAAAAEYDRARATGRPAAMLTRESTDVFTLAVTGLRPGHPVQVETRYVHLARADRGRFTLRVPLTTAPRYTRADEAGTRPAGGQPFAVLRDPGHRFALTLTARGAAGLTSPTHPLAVEHLADGVRVRLLAGDVLPDRDCVLTWEPPADRPLTAWVDTDADGSTQAYLLALATPAARPGVTVPREVVLLVDHSGSMQGPKWEAADWAVERFLGGLTPRDTFALGLFHTSTRWLAPTPQPATPAAVAEAVEFLKRHRDAGGTELGVALEQALLLPRTADAPARHVLIVTDAEVTDSGRLLRLVDAEADRPDRRRVSVLCIDAAPNAALATELADRGGGASRFLTSDPAEDDITTALDEVLAEWAAPAAAGLTLEVNRPTAEATGRAVKHLVPGPAAGIDLGDPPAGKPIWVAARVPLAGNTLTARLTTVAGEVLAEARAVAAPVPGLRQLFGAGRIRRLEALMTGGRPADEVRAALREMGYDPPPAADAVYAENAPAAAGVVKPILVREALAFGLPSAETAFVAVREEPGQVATRTLVVANAAPTGWGRDALFGGMAAGHLLFCEPIGSSPPPRALWRSSSSPAAAADDDGIGYLSALADGVPSPPSVFARLAGSVRSLLGHSAGAAPPERSVPELRVRIRPGQHPTGHGAELLTADGTLPDDCRLTGLTVAGLAAAVDDELALLVYVGDPTVPRARVRLADVVRAGGRRPLNIRRNSGQEVRVIVDDPAGTWAAGVPAFELGITFG